MANMKFIVFFRKCAEVFINKVISVLDRSHLLLMKVKLNFSEEKILSYSLTPKVLSDESDLKGIRPYLDSLKLAIESTNVKNIALMGRYGSGKSTVLMTFRSQNRHLKYLNVSLANFVSRSTSASIGKEQGNDIGSKNFLKSEEITREDRKEKNENKSELRSRDEIEKLIELSVLQQLIFQINDSEIPESRFKRIKHISSFKSFYKAMLFILWCYSILDLVMLSDYSSLAVRSWKLSYSIEWLIFVEVIIGFLGFVVFFKSLLRFLSNSRILKVSIKGEIELGQSDSDSIFNKHIEEIIYFFQRVKVDVVLFEDLDRFPDSQIFSKLREINTLINNSRSNGKSVTFVYSVGDSVFKDKSERVKFFDYIIPITPYLSANNASDVFVRMLEDAGIRDLMSDDFLLDVFTFVSDIDMRLLQNTFNEFVINSKSLPQKLDHEYLFSILLYKNVYPEDFSDLMVGEGNLYRFFERRSDFIGKLSLMYNLRMEEIRNEQVKAKAEHLNNLKELKALYLFEIVKLCDGLRTFNFEDDSCTIEEAVDDKYFDRIVSDEQWRYTTSSGYRPIAKSVNFDKIQARVSESQSYEERKKYYTESTETYLVELSRDLKILESEIRELQSKSVADLINLGEFDNEFEIFKDGGVVRYLISNGKIDEHYHDYIFRVYEDNLPMSDFEFERNVKSSKKGEFYHLISRPDVLLKRIPCDYFNRDSVLNFDLLKYLFENVSQYSEQLDNFFSMVSKSGSLQARFIKELVRIDFEYIPQFFKRLAFSNPDVWRNYMSFIQDEEDLNAFVVCLFKYVPEEDLSSMNATKELDSLLSKNRDFVSFMDKVGDLPDISNYFLSKGVKMELMPNRAESEQLFEFFFENDLYIINRGNIATILMAYEIGFDLEGLKKAPYTQLLSTSVSRLKDYVETNFRDFVLNVLLVQELELFYEESQEVLVGILNRSDIDFRLKTNILQKQRGNIVALSAVKDETLWSMIIRTYKLELSLSNILLYYDYTSRNPEQKRMDEKMIVDFIVQYKDLIGKSFVPNDEVIDKNQELYCHFVNLLLYSELIELDLYKSLMIFVKAPIEGVRSRELPKEKLKVLIETTLIAINPENFKSILDFDNELMLLFVKKVIEANKFSEISDVLEVSEWLSILSAKSINDDLKKIAVSYIDDNLLLANGNLNELSLKYFVLRNTNTFEFDRLKVLLSNGLYSLNKLKLLLSNLFNLSEEELKVCVGLLGNDYSRVFESRNRPSFENHEHHRELFSYLLNRKLISGFKEEGNYIRVHARV